MTSSWLVQGPRAVLGPGTGLGEAQLIWDEKFEGTHDDNKAFSQSACIVNCNMPVRMLALHKGPCLHGSLSWSHAQQAALFLAANRLILSNE